MSENKHYSLLEYMVYTLMLTIIFTAATLALMTTTGCSTSSTTTTTTKYDATGKIIVEQTVIEKKDGWPFRGKSTTIRSNGFGGSITPAADPTTGALPGVQIFKAGMDLDTLPLPDLDELFSKLAEQGKLPQNFVVWSAVINADKSLWGAELSNFYTTWKGGGTMKIECPFKTIYNISGTMPSLTPSTSTEKK